MQNENNEICFEDALHRLEEIVHQLENSNTKLDDSLTLFEEGIHLVKVCNNKIATAEQKVKLIMNTDSEEVCEEDFQK